MLVPLLSEYDPVTLSEGSVDPLGMYPIADRMGVRLAPGIRERQLHPLFLTAIAACAHICAEYDEDTVARDGISKPWQVCEWYVVEGIVRSARTENDVRGLPGRLKAQSALDGRQGLSAARYLKTPAVFGFHGVYRLLARTLDIVDSYDHLGANGYELLVVWEAEQRLPGFVTGSEGAGRTFLIRMRDAVADGLESGKTERSGGWAGWKEVFGHLRHTRKPLRESSLIWQWLSEGESPFLSEIYRYVVSDDARAILADPEAGEAVFHRYVRERCSPPLAESIDSIMAYERFCRALYNGFYAALYMLSDRQNGLSIHEIAKDPRIVDGASRAAALYRDATEKLDAVAFAAEFERTFGVFMESMDTADWLETLIQHHQWIQKAKPPAGKLPWVERLSSGKVIVRAPYAQEERELPGNDVYVHFYRTNSLDSFARDLGVISEPKA